MLVRARLKAALALIVSFVATTVVITAQSQTAAPVRLNLQDTIPLEAAIRTANLPNGVKYYIRTNNHPEGRVSLRLAVKAGSLYEADDQQGLAHLIEHMAFNGSAHFKPGELVAYFESIGARLGPHVNAYTSFDETVYMLEVPTARPGAVEKAITALADFAGGLTLTQTEVDKERGVVIEEWRGGLGASSRQRDKQFPILFYHSRYADRLPIGKPEIIRNAPVERLRTFYDTWYRPERMAVVAVGDVYVPMIEQTIASAFAPLAARAPAAPEPNHAVPLHTELLVSVATDPEVTQSSVSIERKRPRESELKVGDYRQQVVQRTIERMMDERFGELQRKADAKILGAGVNFGNLSQEVATFSMGAAVADGKLEDGIALLAVEAKRAREFGFTASELDRAKKAITASYARGYSERDKTESPSFAAEYIRNFLIQEPSPGIEYEYRIIQQFLPGVTVPDASQLAKSLLSDDSRVILAVSPQKAGIRIPTETELQAALTSASATTVTAWIDTSATRALMERAPTPGSVDSRRTLDDVGVTVVKFKNGVEAWLKPTDFKNDQVLFSLSSPGGSSLAEPSGYVEASLAPAYVDLAGFGGLKASDLQKVLTGQLVSARPFINLSTHGISGSAAPAQLETAMQLVFQEFSAPGDDPEAFALLKRQLDAMVANRGRAPAQVFGEKLAEVNTSNHYTSRPLTAERVGTLDKTKMTDFYRDRFANAADFTLFMVGNFKVDEVVPLLAKYVGALPSNGKRTARFRDVGIHFPAETQRAKVEQGREPRGQTVISFYADPDPNDKDTESLSAATTILEITLRDILREDLGQTYTVSVGTTQPLPQRGEGHVEVRFGAAPENVEPMTARVIQEIKRLQQMGPSEDLLNRAKESARRTYEGALKQNDYWMRRLQNVTMYGGDPSDILKRGERIDSINSQKIRDAFTKYFPVERSTVVTLMPAATQP